MRSVVNFVNSGSKSAIYESVLMSDLLPHESEKDSNDNLSVQLDGLLARGQFAQIWKGSMVKDGIQRPVAVKIFSPDQYKSWAQETEFYTDLRVSLRHSHILEYITSRENINGTPQQHWIITAYHEHGSLRDYLTKYVISWNELCTMGKTLMSGLAQLHSYSTGQDYIPKIPVAHRDMKSSNVLVKCDGTCAIADFGLAMKLDPLTSIDELANMGQVGTPRYMSPEALDCKINLADIESFKHCDMYSVALIIWEMMSRCSISSTMGDYKLPYSDHVPSNPSIEMMKGVLIRDKRRPDVPASWNEHKGMRSLVDTMVDCWDDDPDARLTASCVEFRLGNLSRLDDADFDIFGETRLLDEIDSGMASSTSQVTSSRESTVSSPLHKPRKGPRSTATTRPSVTSEFSDESGMSEVVSPSHRSQRCYKKSFNSDISEENEIIELVNDDDLPMFRQSILISIE
nr:PREDICTED: TGF-beta receptor type-2 [Saccoglossus kowalevskii]